MLIEQLFWLGAYAAVVSLAISVLIVLSQRWHGKLSYDHELDGVQKMHTTAVPRIGGLAVFGGVIGGLCLFDYFQVELMAGVRASSIGMLLIVSLPAYCAGMVEDISKRVSVRLRLGATLCSALLASLMLGATVDQLNIWGVDQLLLITPIAVVITAVVVAGGANAVNIIDGFNGLSSATLMVMAAGLSAIAWQNDDMLVVALGVLCIGATLGFFMVNYPFGKLFLGDGGAYLLGFWVAEMAVLLLVRRPEVNAWQVLAICAYPIIEVAFSIYRRKFVRKVSPGAPDALHLHTLVYRRALFSLIRRDPRRLWKRNAAVSCVIVPVVALWVAASAVIGDTTMSAITLVCAQVLLYVVCYRRLVFGRWLSRPRRRAPASGRSEIVHALRKIEIAPALVKLDLQAHTEPGAETIVAQRSRA